MMNDYNILYWFISFLCRILVNVNFTGLCDLDIKVLSSYFMRLLLKRIIKFKNQIERKPQKE